VEDLSCVLRTQVSKLKITKCLQCTEEDPSTTVTFKPLQETSNQRRTLAMCNIVFMLCRLEEARKEPETAEVKIPNKTTGFIFLLLTKNINKR
jgi:hypothetical protein